MTKEWKRLTIHDFETIYIISNYGDIKNIYGTHGHDHELTDFITDTGYRRIGLWYKGRQKKFFVHQLVALTFVSGYEEGLQVNHKDGDKDNNFYDNLEWVTGSNNLKHAIKNKLLLPPIGTKNGMCKNTEDDIIRVCELIDEGLSCTQISFSTKVNECVIRSIKKGKRWVHISKDFDFIKYKKKKRFNDYRNDDVYIDLEDNYILPEVKLIFIAS